MNRAMVIGIDFGSSKSCLAVMENEDISIIPNEIGERTTPSCVSFSEKERFFGDIANKQITKNPNNTLFSIKRLIGENYETNYLNKFESYPYIIRKNNNSDNPQIEVKFKDQKKIFCLEEIIAMIFQNLKHIVNNFLGSETKDAVIGVPTYFNYFQRENIKCSMTISGFNCLRIIDECSAVALFYSFRKQIENEETILIFDLGAGSLSVAIANINKGDGKIVIEMKSLNGDLHLGGEDFDDKLLDFCCNEFRKKK